MAHQILGRDPTGLPRDINVSATGDLLIGGTTGMLQAGTITMLQAGTVSKLQSGTISMSQAGTITMLQAGTIQADPRTIAPPLVYNITLSTVDTEYSQVLPANCRGFEFQARTDVAVRYAFVAGLVAASGSPFATLKTGDYYYSYPINQGSTAGTIFLASATAATVVEMLAWV